MQSFLRREVQQCFGLRCERGSLLLHLSYLHKKLIVMEFLRILPGDGKDEMYLWLISFSCLLVRNDGHFYSGTWQTYWLYHFTPWPKANKLYQQSWSERRSLYVNVQGEKFCFQLRKMLSVTIVMVVEDDSTFFTRL